MAAGSCSKATAAGRSSFTSCPQMAASRSGSALAQGRYGTPVWSPRGDLIAFTKQNKGRFHIGVMRVDGSEERLLTASFLDEGPTWAPNGRVHHVHPRNARRAGGRPRSIRWIFPGATCKPRADAGRRHPTRRWSPLAVIPATANDDLCADCAIPTDAPAACCRIPKAARLLAQMQTFKSRTESMTHILEDA